MSNYLQGQAVVVSAQITDVAGQPADPGEVVLKIKSGSGVLTTKAVREGEIERTATGAYRCNVALTEKGRWWWRWETSAPYQGACEGFIVVEGSNFY